MKWEYIHILILLFSLLLSLILTPIFRGIAIKLEFFDLPLNEAHKKHRKAIPLLGGAAIIISWLLTISAGYLISFFIAPMELSGTLLKNIPGIISVQQPLMLITIGGILIFILGLCDDKKHMSAITKLIFQIIIVALVVIFGEIKISLFIGSPVIGKVITILWILTVINAINIFDNMDGLAVGTASIAFCFFTVTAIIYNHYFVASLGAAGLGASLGFWFYNKAPASIFMGDAGSHFLGYSLGVLSVLVTFYQTGITVSGLSVFIPFFILAIPIFDLVAVIIIRILTKNPIYIGDNNHISHRFNKIGMSRKKAVFAVHLLSITIGLSVLPLLWGDEKTCIISFIQACTLLLLITIIQYSTKNNK